jgi:UDP-hydrolysing UDP-N-acetyl-D-glucosamine 2-epimerase
MKIAFFTGSRSEYGLLKNLINLCKKNKIQSYLIVTGSHLSKKYGYSKNEILKDKIKINKVIKLNLNHDTNFTIGKAFGDLLKSTSLIFKRNKFNLIILIGDRYETFAAAIAAYIFQIPILHIHGGESTADSLDDNYRHCISKLSNIHCVSHLKYKKRLQQLGEKKKNIFVTGGLGAEAINNQKYIKLDQLEKDLKINLKKKIIVINFYPEISDLKKSFKNLKDLLKVLKVFSNKNILIFTLPSHDIGSHLFSLEIKKFCDKNNNSFFYKNLGQQKYLSLLKVSSLIVGNSSSGILEMPSFKKFSINIGNRQLGRVLSKSVINSSPNFISLKNKINKYINKKSHSIKNVYFRPNTSLEILKIIKKVKNNKINLNKKFIDIYN